MRNRRGVSGRVAFEAQPQAASRARILAAM
jgi:hypothetical protein